MEAQTLYVKETDIEGNVTMKPVLIRAAWSDANLGTIYLHANTGVYGYKDGAPARSKDELEKIIKNPVQLKLALLWWEKVGERLSKEYYAKKMQEEEERVTRAMTGQSGDAVEHDLVMYQVRSTKDKSEKAYGPPLPWSALFDRRPDWWGPAATISIGDRYFRRLSENVEAAG